MGMTLTSQIKTALQRVKSYTASHISELAQATTELFEEVDAVKADKPQAVAVTIPATGWQEDATEGAAYPLYYDIAASGVTAADIASVCITPDGQAAAIACGLCPTCETLAGVIRLRAKSAPTAEFASEYSIMQGYTGGGQ